MENWLTGITGMATAFIAGIAIGALLWYWRVSIRARRTLRKGGGASALLWDVHSVLNTMNKLALAAERGRPSDPALIYLLSDYLLHSALIQREDGWADHKSLEGWLQAHARIIADHRGFSSLAAITVRMHKNVWRIQTKSLVRQLMAFLQKVGPVHEIRIEVLATAQDHPLAKVRVEIASEPAECGRDTPAAEASASAWHLEDGLAVLETRTAFEPGPPKP